MNLLIEVCCIGVWHFGLKYIYACSLLLSYNKVIDRLEAPLAGETCMRVVEKKEIEQLEL